MVASSNAAGGTPVHRHVYGTFKDGDWVCLRRDVAFDCLVTETDGTSAVRRMQLCAGVVVQFLTFVRRIDDDLEAWEPSDVPEAMASVLVGRQHMVVADIPTRALSRAQDARPTPLPVAAIPLPASLPRAS